MFVNEEHDITKFFDWFYHIQVRNVLGDIAKKEGIDDTPQSIFAYLIERVRNNLHVVLGMSPVGEDFRWVGSRNYDVMNQTPVFNEDTL